MSERVEVVDAQWSAVIVPQSKPADVIDVNTLASQLMEAHGNARIGDKFHAMARLAIHRCAGRVPAAVWDVLAEMRRCDSDGVELYAVTAYADKLEAALKSSGQVAPKLFQVTEAEFEEAWKRASGPHRGIASRLDVRDAINAVLEQRPADPSDEGPTYKDLRDACLRMAAEWEAAPPSGKRCAWDLRVLVAPGQAGEMPAEPAVRPRLYYEQIARIASRLNVSIERVRQAVRAEDAEVDAEPAPRALSAHGLAERWTERADRAGGSFGDGLRHAARELREHAAPAAARALPTRESIASRLGKAYAKAWGAGATDFETACDRVRDGLLAEAAEVLVMLREHAAPADEASGAPRSMQVELDSLRAGYEMQARALSVAKQTRDMACEQRDEAERERDEARATIERHVRNMRESDARYAELRKERDYLQSERDEARGDVRMLQAQLAAWPETVVIDEALATAMCDAFWDGPRNTGYTGTDERDMLRALRSVLGEKVSVAGLRTDDQRAYELLSDECGVLRGECREYRAEIDKLRAELQAAQRDFESCKGSLACALKANEEGTAALSTLRKQHEALRAAAERVAGLYSNAQEVIALRALLKPATTEAQAPAPRWEDQPSATNDFQTLRAEFKERLKTKEPEQWVNASPADALRPNDRHAQRPASEALTFTEQVERFAKLSVQPPENGAVSSRPPVPASLAPLWDRFHVLREFVVQASHGDTIAGAKAALDRFDEIERKALDAGKQGVGNADRG